MPVYALFENLESGATVREFLEWFSEVREWQVAGCPQARSGTPQSANSHMKVLFDHGTPAPLRRHFPESVDRSGEKGWDQVPI